MDLQIKPNCLTLTLTLLIWRPVCLVAGNSVQTLLPLSSPCPSNFTSGTGSASGMESSSPASPPSFWTVSLVCRRLRRFLLNLCPSSVITSQELGPTSWRTVAFLFLVCWSCILTESSLNQVWESLWICRTIAFVYSSAFPYLIELN